MESFDQIKEYCKHLVSRYGARDAQLESIRRMFHMEWGEAPKEEWIKPTMSPTAYNAVLGAVRTLVSGEPQVTVPFDANAAQARTASEKLEKAARTMLMLSGRVTKRKCHHEAVFSAVLFGEACCVVTPTDVLSENIAKTDNAAATARAKWIQKKAPYLFQFRNPQYVYNDYDSLGLRASLYRVQTTWGEVLATWGSLAEGVITGTKKMTDTVTLNDYYDWDQRCVWLEDTNEAIYQEEHGLPFMPVVSNVAEGSFLFERPELQRLPLLYGLEQSGLWKRENLALTIVYSLMHARGSMPLWKRKGASQGSTLNVGKYGPINFLDLGPDEDVAPFADQVIDPSVITALGTAQQLGQQTTLSAIAMGQSPNSNMTFSTLSLLAGQGRLPLVSPKDAAGAVLAEAVEVALKWWKEDGGKKKMYARNGEALELSAEEIPDEFNITVNIEADLPQDKLQMANTGQMLKNSQLASKRWVRENILNIGQSETMDKEILFEQMLEARIAVALQQAQQPSAAMTNEQLPMNNGMSADMQPSPQPSPNGEGARSSAGLPQDQANMMQGLPPDGQVGPGMPMMGPTSPKYQQAGR